MLHKRIKKEEGQSLVEFALLLPVVLLIMCAVIDFGWLFAHQLVLSNAVRDGARLGITCVDEASFSSKVTQRVRNETGICEQSALRVNARVSGDDVVVEADYDLRMLTPMASLIVGGMEHCVSSTCTMRAE